MTVRSWHTDPLTPSELDRRREAYDADANEVGAVGEAIQ
jgi:hypothetical protein